MSPATTPTRAYSRLNQIPHFMKTGASFVLLCVALPVLNSPMQAAESGAIGLDEVVTAASAYQSGQNAEPLRGLEEAVRQSVGNAALRKQVEAGLLKLLEPSSSYEAKKFACQTLAIIGSDAALPQLAGLLNEEETVSLACLALTTYPPGKADEVLRDALKWVNGKSRAQVIDTLGERRDSQAVSLLAATASDPDRLVAEAAIGALAKIGTPAALKGLANLKRGDGAEYSHMLDEAKLRAADTLKRSGQRRQAMDMYEKLLADSQTVAVRRTALAALLSLDRDGGEQRILEILENGPPELRPIAIAGMGAVGNPGSTEKFAGQLQRLKPEEQALVLESIARNDSNAARLELAKALSSPEPLVRRAAIVALGNLGDPYFASLLARSSSLASDPEEARAIETALVNLKGGAQTDQQLLAVLKTSLAKPRVQLISAVARRLGSKANPVLLEEVDNTDPAVAKAAFRALGKTGVATNAPQLLLKLTKLQDAGVRSEAESATSQVLARVDSSDKRSAMVNEALAKATTPEAKASLLPLLQVCGDSAGLPTLAAAAADPEPVVRDAAVRTLAEWPDSAARATLLALYRESQDKGVHELALRGLVRLAGEANTATAPQQFRQLIVGARGDTDLKLILGGLGGCPQPDALALVLPLLSNPAVRAEAIVAVKRIAEASKAQNPQLAEEALKRLPAQ